jgi:hypothetical protein
MGEFWFNELRAAIRDVRHKLLDEGWFGRRSSSNMQADGFTFDFGRERDPGEKADDRRQSFDEQWAVKERSQERGNQEHGLDIDR